MTIEIVNFAGPKGWHGWQGVVTVSLHERGKCIEHIHAKKNMVILGADKVGPYRCIQYNTAAVYGKNLIVTDTDDHHGIQKYFNGCDLERGT